VWGSNRETVSTTAYPSTPEWEVIPTRKDKMDYLRVIVLSNARNFSHIAVSKEKTGIVSLKEVQVFSKKSEFHCLFTIKTLYKMTVKWIFSHFNNAGSTIYLQSSVFISICVSHADYTNQPH